MNIFIYDKTFEGLLAVVFDAFTLKRFPEALYGPDDILPLTAEGAHAVRTEPEKGRRVFAALEKKLSRESLRSMLHTWLSEVEGSEMSLCRYICKALRAEKSIENDMADPDVWEVVRLRRKVGKEVERFLGFVRFQKSRDGVYFSAIAPKYNVIPLISGNFAERFHDQRWIIYDLTRHYGIMFKPGGSSDSASACASGGGFQEVFLDERRLEDGFLRREDLAPDELLLEELWRGYHAAATIRERSNPRLQRNFMPKRFWGLLTEKRRPTAGRGAPPAEADLL